MATKPEFVVAKEKMLVPLVTVSVAISSPDSLRLTIVTSNVLGLKKKQNENMVRRIFQNKI